jgi:hypothetical protein
LSSGIRGTAPPLSRVRQGTDRCFLLVTPHALNAPLQAAANP